MKKILNLIAVLALASGTIMLDSCRKHKLNKDTTSAEDDAVAQNMFDDVFKVVDESAKEDGVELGKTGVPIDYTFNHTCVNITLDPPFDTIIQGYGSWPVTLTVDFGTSCVGHDNKTRRGKVIATFTGKYRDEGTTITITTENYYVDDYKVEGTKILENKGRNAAGNLYYTIDVDGVVTTPEGDVISWKSNREREWIEGEETTWFSPQIDANGDTIKFANGWPKPMLFDGILDDAYSITGDGSGINRNGRNFTVTITKALRVEFCGWIPEVTEGTVELQPEDLKKRIVDFGSGDCDREYSVTIGKRDYVVKY